MRTLQRVLGELTLMAALYGAAACVVLVSGAVLVAYAALGSRDR